MNIVSFSGGKDSTAMLLMMLEKGIPVDRVICVDTSKEFPQMYEHIKKVQAMIEPLKIEIIKIDFDYWFGERIKTRGRIGEVGYSWPGILSRWCTGLKRNAIRKVKSRDDVGFVGIAFEEKERTLKNKGSETLRYPLVEWQITEKEALAYCYSKGLDWGGLYETFHRVSCWCCPFQRLSELRALRTYHPDLWQRLREMDLRTRYPFKGDVTVADLERRFAEEDRQGELPGMVTEELNR